MVIRIIRVIWVIRLLGTIKVTNFGRVTRFIRDAKLLIEEYNYSDEMEVIRGYSTKLVSTFVTARGLLETAYLKDLYIDL